MRFLCSIILLAAALSSLAEASAIKGHAHQRQAEEARSIKLASVSNTLDKAAKVATTPQQQAPILESSKKIYNDESIRRLAAVAPIETPVVKQPEVAVAAAPVVVKQQEAAVVGPVAVVPAVVAAYPKEATVEAKSAPVVKAPEVPVASVVAPLPVAQASAPAVVKAAEELPLPSDRSAPVKVAEAPVVPVASVPVVEVVAPVKPAVEPIVAPIVVAQPAAPVEVPVVVPEKQPVVVAKSSVVEPAKFEASLQAKKDEPEPLHIDVPAPDPGLVLSEPIDSTTKLLIDLDEHVQKFLPAEDQQQPQAPKDPQGGLVAGVDYSPAGEPSGKSSAPLAPYFPAGGADEPIVPPLPAEVEKNSASAGSNGQAAAAPQSPLSVSSVPSSSSARQGNNHPHPNQQQVISQLLEQLESLQKRITETIDQLVARRRYVMSALLRPMGTYVRRVRTNLERLQNRVNQLQAAAVSVGGGQNRPGGFVDAAAIETIRRRIDDISKRISDIVNRIRFSLTPTSAPLNNGR